VRWGMKRKRVLVQSVQNQGLIADIRKAEQEWKLAEWRFHHALGEDHVDYSIYCLEAAEKKLSMLLKQAKWQWSRPNLEEGEGAG
jgi:Protein of unknown function (DUF2508)